MSEFKRKVSGDVLARILNQMHLLNLGRSQFDKIGQILSDEISRSENLYCDVELENSAFSTYSNSKRTACFDESSFSKLDVMLPWSSYFNIDPIRTVGTPWSTRKRSDAQPFPDPKVENLNRIIPLKDLSVLEVGCYEGHHTASLALHSSDVWAIDGRIENVIKTLVRTWLGDCGNNVNVNFIDLETNSLVDGLLKLGRTKNFDLIHHRGVLYHLSHPVSHLKQCSDICDRYLYLHTQIADEDNANSDLEVDGNRYRVLEYKEPLIDVSPYAGITKFAYWLTQESLIKALKYVGFNQIKILNLKSERNGPRIELLAYK